MDRGRKEMDYNGRDPETETKSRRPESAGQDKERTGRRGRNRASNERKRRDRESETYPSSYDGMNQADFLEQSKLHQVLSAFKEDVVRIKSTEKTKWREAVESVRNSGISIGDDFPSSTAAFQQNGREREDGPAPGADMATSGAASWKMALQKIKSGEKSQLNSKSMESIAEMGSSDELQPRIDPSIIQNAPLLKCFIISNKISFYCSGILVGLLVARAWFESLLTSEENWMSSSSSILSSMLCPITTILILFTVIGFLNRVDTIREDPKALWDLILHLIPVLTILICHYLNTSLELQRKECFEYLKMAERAAAKPYRDEHHTSLCENYKKETQEPIFVTIRCILAIVAFGLYTFIHFSKTGSIFSRVESSIYPNRRMCCRNQS